MRDYIEMLLRNSIASVAWVDFSAISIQYSATTLDIIDLFALYMSPVWYGWRADPATLKLF